MEFFPRFLEEGVSATEGNETLMSGNETLVSPMDSVIIKSTLRTYGSLYFVLIALFCFLRVRYPRAFNVRSWAPNVTSELAQKDHFGAISWFWKVWFISDDDFREKCGMDALCFVRIYRFGLKVALVGMFNSLWLLPVYGTSPKTSDNEHITDHLAILTVGHIPPGDPRFLATVLAAYIHFGFIMYTLLQEFTWFTEHRHKYLSSKQPSNYTVYVSHIPLEYRTSAKLLDYFRSCFGQEAVLEAHVALEIPNLENQFASREKLIAKLEHAINVEEIQGKTPMHRNLLAGKAKVNSIDFYSEELKESNDAIRRLILGIESEHHPMSFKDDLEACGGSVQLRLNGADDRSISDSSAWTFDTNPAPRSSFKPNLNGLDENKRSKDDYPTSCSSSDGSEGKDDPTMTATTSPGLFKSLKLVTDKAGSSFNSVKNVAGDVGAMGLSLVLGAQDGEAREAGFVTFTNLKTAQAALQQIHNETPFVMEVAEAPMPDDIYWVNVGKSHKSLQLGKLASFSLTALLCLFWTIPVAFIVTLTEVESLKGTIPFLGAWVEAWPALELVLAQMAPLVLIIVKGLLPVILGAFSALEGPVSSSVLESSLFVKLAIFEIVQTFFVSTFSGSITSEITNIINDPSQIVTLLANSIPGQSSYFLQILFVQTFLGQGLELLRVVPVAIASVRSFIGPNLTEKERNTAFLGFLRPLACPTDFEFADVVSNGILYFMVIFVYGTMAPITNWFLAFCFVIMISGYRHQLVFNYPPTPDSGGELWIGFIGIAQTCMLIAQLALVGFLALKKATIAAPCMFPLIIITMLFNVYVRQRHFLVSRRLPSRAALKTDLQNQAAGVLNMSFVRGKYAQPALQSKDDVYPENFGAAREMEHEQVAFLTPPASEADIRDDDGAFDGDFGSFNQTFAK